MHSNDNERLDTIFKLQGRYKRMAMAFMLGGLIGVTLALVALPQALPYAALQTLIIASMLMIVGLVFSERVGLMLARLQLGGKSEFRHLLPYLQSDDRLRPKDEVLAELEQRREERHR